jgi:hypothetical protein
MAVVSSSTQVGYSLALSSQNGAARPVEEPAVNNFVATTVDWRENEQEITILAHVGVREIFHRKDTPCRMAFEELLYPQLRRDPPMAEYVVRLLDVGEAEVVYPPDYDNVIASIWDNFA